MKTLWRDNVKLNISDPYKTILDIIDDPYLGAGLQHTVDCLSELKKSSSNSGDLERFLKYAIQFNNGALFKKLGFLAEKLEFKPSFVEECSNRLTTGYTFLDKTAENNKLVTRWRLWVPEGFEA